MDKTNYNRGGGGAGRDRGGGSGCGRGVSGGGRCSSGGGRGGNNYQKYHRGKYQTGAGNSGGNNCQQHNQDQYQSGGYGRRGGRGGDRSGTQMGTNPPPARGDRPVQDGQSGTQWPESATGLGAGATGGRGAWSGVPPHVAGRGSWASGAGQAQFQFLFMFLFMFLFLMGTNPPPAQPWKDWPVQGGQGGTQWPESVTGLGAGATGGRGAWSGGPPHVAGRGSWASAVGGGTGAGQAQFLFLFMFLLLLLFLFLFTMLPLVPIGDKRRCNLLLQLRHQLLSYHHRLHLRLHLSVSSD